MEAGEGFRLSLEACSEECAERPSSFLGFFVDGGKMLRPLCLKSCGVGNTEEHCVDPISHIGQLNCSCLGFGFRTLSDRLAVMVGLRSVRARLWKFKRQEVFKIDQISLQS